MIEYDLHKSKHNKEKHGIDFEEAKELFFDPDLIELPAKNINEPRYLMIGRIKNKYWSAIITNRGRNMRLISVRRSRPEEVDFYEST